MVRPTDPSEAGAGSMKINTSRLAQIALVVVLVAALAVPGIALAQPQAKGLRVKASQAAQKAGGFKQPQAQMEKRIDNVLAARSKRFAAAEKNITKRIERLRSIATSLADEGADQAALDEANATLDSAQAHLDAALANEVEVADLFKAIPTAENRRAAFFEARAAGRQSVAELKAARKDVRDAAHQLRAIVQSMKPTEDTEESDS